MQPMKKMSRRVAVQSLAFFPALLLAVLMGASAWAAAPQAALSHTIRGNVEDSTGSAIAGAQITLRDAAGAAKGTSTSDAEGRFGTLFIRTASRSSPPSSGSPTSRIRRPWISITAGGVW